MKTKFIFVALLLLKFSLFSQSSNPKTLNVKNVLEAWDRMTNMVISTTKKMPAEHFGFSPIEPLATYGDLVGHTAGANYLFGPTVNLNAPEDQMEVDSKNKDQVIQNLEESFRFIRGGIENLTNDQLFEEIEWFGSKMSRLQAILTMTDHLQREYGKNITYVRLKGIAPQRSAGW